MILTRCSRCKKTYDAVAERETAFGPELICDACDDTRRAIGEEEALSLIRAIESGEALLSLPPGGLSWNDTYCGDVEFLTSTGWTVFVFNDCAEWDYFDRLIAPDGRRLEFKDMPDAVRNYRPETGDIEALYENAKHNAASR